MNDGSVAQQTARDSTATASPRQRWRAFEGFRFAPFRWYMGAMIWWNAAMSMQMLVRGYLAFHLTDSFASLGVVGLASAVPMLFFSPIGGLVADRRSRRAVLQLGQVVSLVIAATVAALLFSDALEFWHLVLASVVHGVTFALVMPSRQSLLPEVVGMGRLMNTIPLQTAGMNLMQILAPASGGFLIDWIGPEWVYVSMSAMYAMSVGMLFFVQTLSAEEMARSRADAPGNAFVADSTTSADDTPPVESSRSLDGLASGFAYLARDRTTLSLLAFAFLASLLGMPIRMLLPGYAGAVFGDAGSTLGLLQMGMGLGALIGALVLASLRVARHRGLLLAASTLFLGGSLIAFSSTGVFWIAWVTLLMVGIGSAGRMAMGQVLIQEYVQNEYRGRVMAIYMMQFSLMSVGTFAVSLYMEIVGAEQAILSLGVILILATAAFVAFVPRFRSIA
ncbi:MAG: MFS transporter [Ilumatobacteraceae bacterium]